MYAKNNKMAVVLNKKRFTPRSIANLSLWLDAADTATITQVAGAVSQWNDKSGNAYHATQATGANQPITNTRTVNSKNVLDFDGSNDYMATAAFTAISQPLTIFLVMQLDQTSTTKGVTQTFVDGILTTNRAVIYSITAPSDFRVYAGATVTGSAADTNLNCHTFVANGASSSIRKNGGTAVTGNAGTHTLTGVTIGSRFNFVENTDGVYCEYIIYNSSLSNANMNLVGNYLATKWGFTWTNL